MKIGEMDLQIASIAQANELPVATHNARHFRRIPGLQVVDWLTD
jgi:predicted nucleic acid-binding protein